MKIKSNKIVVILLLMLIGSACVEKMALPTNFDKPEFSAGDTTYLQLNPIWDHNQSLVTPVEISIANDGHVFVADSADKSIKVFTRNGELLTQGFESLMNLKTESGQDLYPIDVNVDDKMNVFYIDGTHKIYVWNQYINDSDIKSVVSKGLFTNTRNGDTITVEAGTQNWHSLMLNNDWILTEKHWDDSDELIQYLKNPHVFYDGSAPINRSIDIFYQGDISEFSAVAAYSGDLNKILVTDYKFDRIIEVSMGRSWYVVTGKNDSIWLHDGVFKKTVSGYGTGTVTVNKPLGLDIDYNGTIYYSQEGKHFGVHAINGGTSKFQGDIDEIMELNRFAKPMDISVGDDQFIYVSDSENEEVQVFDSYGNFFRKAGVEKIYLDTTIVIDSVPIDTFYVKELKGYLEQPAGIAVDDRGVIYVCDPPTGRIVRYQLSNKLDENQQPQD